MVSPTGNGMEMEVRKTVEVILSGNLLQSYPILHRGFEVGSAHHAATDRDFIEAARRCAIEDDILSVESAEEAHFIVRD